MAEDDEVELTEEEIAKLAAELIQVMEAASRIRKEVPIQIEPDPPLEPTTERERALFEILKATIDDLEKINKRVIAIEDFLLLKYRSKDTLSH